VDASGASNLVTSLPLEPDRRNLNTFPLSVKSLPATSGVGFTTDRNSGLIRVQRSRLYGEARYGRDTQPGKSQGDFSPERWAGGPRACNHSEGEHGRHGRLLA
jgi:hypothetical protein